MLKVLCIEPGCKEFAVSGHRLCKKHLKESEERKKEYCFKNATRSNEGKYNTYRWRMLRKFIIEHHPYCSRCGTEGSKYNTLTVDHIQPPRGDEELFYDKDNLQVLCRHCHNLKTRKEIEERKHNQ